jgi:hypothetical protein
MTEETLQIHSTTMMMIMRSISLTFLALLLGASVRSVEASQRGNLANPDEQNIQLMESDRIEAYHERNYTWPIDSYVPNTAGWKSLMESRFQQVEEMEEPVKRYEGYIQTIHSAFLVPNFTEFGFGLARAPPELTEALQKGIRDGIPTARLEHRVDIIHGPQALFVDRPDLTARVLHELKHYAEEWSQTELTAYRAYGFRLYRNQSQLMMHVDKMQTHIISFIYHIDSSDDAEPVSQKMSASIPYSIVYRFLVSYPRSLPLLLFYTLTHLLTWCYTHVYLSFYCSGPSLLKTSTATRTKSFSPRETFSFTNRPSVFTAGRAS